MQAGLTKSSVLIFLFALVFFFANGELLRYDKNKLAKSKAELTVNDPGITGPDKLCIVFGSVIGDFFGAGDAATDVYSWKIYSPTNQLLFQGTGGAGFQTISYTFSIIGKHHVELAVHRAGVLIKEDQKEVELIQGPIPLLKSTYSVCVGQEINLIAIDPTSPGFSDYIFNWTDATGETVSTSNSFKTAVLGEYFVNFYFLNQNGIPECETQLPTTLTASSIFDVVSSVSSTCPGEQLTFTSIPLVIGDWAYEKSGGPRTFIQSGSSITISSDQLDGPGSYKIFLTLGNTANPECIQEKSINLSYTPRPEFEFIGAKPSSGCLNPDGAIQIRAVTAIDQLLVDGTSVSGLGLAPGDIVDLSGLKSGTYTVFGTLGSCVNSLATVIPLDNRPIQLEFDIIDIQPEICTETGKQNGSFTVKIINGSLTGSYKVINERGGLIRSGTIVNQPEIVIEIPGGLYYFELFDEDVCSLPKNDKIEVPALEQVTFSVPTSISVCQSYELIPQSSQLLEYTLIYPDLREQIKMANESFTLTEAGTYQVKGILPNQTAICPTLKEFTVSLVDPVVFEPRLIKEDCFGNRTYQADIFGIDPSTVVFTWYNDSDEIVGNGEFLFPTSFGEFKLDVQPEGSEACPIPPKVILIDEPVLSVDMTLDHSKLCELGPGSIISLTIDRPDAVTNITWRRYDYEGNIENLPQFNNAYEITVTDPGTYEAAAFSIIPAIGKDCELGRNSIEIEVTPDRVEFDIPSQLWICETYDLVPSTTQNLVFKISQPDGTTVSKNAGEVVTLDQQGIYSFFGYNPDFEAPLCPEIKILDVTLYQKISFTPILFQEDCSGEKIYKAEIGKSNPDHAIFSWKDASGSIIGSEQFLTLNSYGSFSLDVQPLGSLPCEQMPIDFEVSVPVLALGVSLLATTLCPDAASATLYVEADFTEVSKIEWWFTDLNGKESILPNEPNKKEILAIHEGTYEVRLFNQIPCMLGYDKALIIRSTDNVRPETEENYQICPKYDIAPFIDPGSFASYEWYFGDQLVSTNALFKPLSIGNYRLIVYSEEGCAYQADFTTEEECELNIIYPTAVQSGNPSKKFLLYTNYLIDELDLVILNKWGQVVFKCSETNLISEEYTCTWDGTYNGEAIPNGTYAVRINFKNHAQNISKSEFGSILIIE